MNLKEVDRKMFFAITILLIVVVGGFFAILIAGANRTVGEAVSLTYSYSFYSRYDDNLENEIEKIPSITKPFNVGEYIVNQDYRGNEYAGATISIKVDEVRDEGVNFEYLSGCGLQEVTSEVFVAKGEDHVFQSCDGFEKPHIWTVQVNR